MKSSSPLLIHESPLQVLPSLAVKVGLHEAIILQQIHYWITQPRAYKRDGASWVYNTYKEWTEQFPFLSAVTIKRAMLELETKKVLVSRQFDLNRGDARKYYTINYKELNDLFDDGAQDQNDPIHEIKMIPPSDQNDPTLGSKRSHLIRTETTAETNTETTAAVTTTTRATEKTAADLRAFASKQEKAHIDTLNLDVAVREACGLSNVWDQSTERRVCNTVTALENNGFTIADVQAYRATRKKTPNLAYLLNDMLTWRNASQQPATRLAPKFTEPPNWNQMSNWDRKKYKDNWYKTAFSTV